jgi:hypothetical protein
MRPAALLALLVACGTTKNTPRADVRMSAKDIVNKSSTAIVRVEVANERLGTGFILDKNGLIATNLHVVAGAADIKVRLNDGTVFKVEQIAGFDKDHDLALLRITPAKALPTLSLGDSDRMTAGDQVVAIGNPLGVLDYTVSDGLVSSVRTLCGDHELGEIAKQCTDPVKLLQISTPISQGSSGGPLFNQQGEVIGLTTAILGAGQLLNFAVPANYLKPLVAKQIALAPDEFATRTKEFAEHGHKPDGDNPNNPDPDGPLPNRNIPHHALAVWDGCSPRDIDDTAEKIEGAIRLGVPLYNTRTQDGFEACERIYEGAALRLERDGACKGVRAAFTDGVGRVDSIKSYRDKAWALRDTFDGILSAREDWLRAGKPSTGPKAPPTLPPPSKK